MSYLACSPYRKFCEIAGLPQQTTAPQFAGRSERVSVEYDWCDAIEKGGCSHLPAAGWESDLKRFAAILLVAAFIVTTLAIGPTLAQQKTTITFWHAMGAQLGKTIDMLVEQFNLSLIHISEPTRPY